MKHVLVSGGSRGLGLAIIDDLLGAGWRVSTCSRDRTDALDALAGTHGDRLFWTRADLADADAAQGVVAAAMEAAPPGMPLWGLVNNAGIAREGVLATFPEVEIERILETNLLSAFRLTRAALRTLLRQDAPGRVINISSIIGLRGFTGLSAYSASKAGLDGMTRAVAREVGRRGITVNSVAPGYLETEMSAGLGEAQRDQVVRRTPMGRLGTCDDVVPLVRFLLSEESGFITGQVIAVDGGGIS